jgi:hypothetical protein
VAILLTAKFEESRQGELRLAPSSARYLSISGCWVGPQDPKDVARDTAPDLSGVVGELAALNGDATHWLTDPEYAALRLRLEVAHAAAEAALVEARLGVRPDEERGR